MILELAVASTLAFTPTPIWDRDFDWTVAAVSAVPVGVGQLLGHEASHGLWASAAGAKDIKYTLYPTVRGDTFTFARVDWPSDNGAGALGWAPLSAQLFDIGVVVGIAIIDNVCNLPTWLHTILKVWQVAAIIDFTYNMTALWGNNQWRDFNRVYYGQMHMAKSEARGLAITTDLGLAIVTMFL
jgi:hypothetical protein